MKIDRAQGLAEVYSFHHLFEMIDCITIEDGENLSIAG